MSNPDEQASHFIKYETEFHLGCLVTEQSHPLTVDLSATAAGNPSEALSQLLSVDTDMFKALSPIIRSGAPARLAEEMYQTLVSKGRIFFVGCGSTGRLSILLDSIWRKFFKRLSEQSPDIFKALAVYADATRSIMSGGDHALIKSVEGYEDFAEFGQRQMRDAGLTSHDLVVAITEGGETSFVIGAAWAGVSEGATTWFIYNNPDNVLYRFQRCRQVLECEQIRRICLASGSMAITGSTRMQATSSEFAVVGAAMEEALGRLFADAQVPTPSPLGGLARLTELDVLNGAFTRPDNIDSLSRMVALEHAIYQSHGFITYAADHYSLDLLTDTTERAPTFSVPPFAKHDDPDAKPSWAYVVTPRQPNVQAWTRLLGRDPIGLDWSLEEIANMLPAGIRPPSLPKLTLREILRFDITLAGLNTRLRDHHDGLILFLCGQELHDTAAQADRYTTAIAKARQCGAKLAIFAMGTQQQLAAADSWLNSLNDMIVLRLVIPNTCNSLLNIHEHLCFKMLMNAASTVTMCLLGRVYGNVMTWVVPSNKKLNDRATRYVSLLTNRPYDESCRAVFRVRPELQRHLATGMEITTPVVVLAAVCLLKQCHVEEAERLIAAARKRGCNEEAFLAQLRQPSSPLP